MKKTKETFTDPRDGKVYKTVKIGEQIWLAENLAYNAEGSKCYGDDESNCQKYGRLYDFETAMKVCPEGWHLPSKEEWQILMDFAGGDIADDSGFAALLGGCGDSENYFSGIGYCGYWWSSSKSYAYNGNSKYVFFCDNRVGLSKDNKNCLLSVRCVQDNSPKRQGEQDGKS